MICLHKDINAPPVLVISVMQLSLSRRKINRSKYSDRLEAYRFLLVRNVFLPKIAHEHIPLAQENSVVKSRLENLGCHFTVEEATGEASLHDHRSQSG